MGKSLQELGGLLLISDAGGFWGTEWDDQPIRPENFREWKKKETESRKETEKTGTEYQKAAEKTGREREEKEEENQKRWNLPEVQKSEGVRQDHDGGGDSGGCIKDIGNRKFISGSQSASAGTTTTRPAVTASAGTTTARPAVTASAETIATGAISFTSGNTL